MVVVLRGLAATMRAGLHIRRQAQVPSGQSRYSAYVIGALPILLFTFLWFTNRPYISVLFEPGLRLLLGGAVAGLLIGFFLMQRIVKMDV